jgi:hypothetical protein
MKTYVGAEAQLHVLTSALDGGEWSPTRFGQYNPRNGPRYPLDSRLSRPQSRSSRGGQDKRTFTAPVRNRINTETGILRENVGVRGMKCEAKELT